MSVLLCLPLPFPFPGAGFLEKIRGNENRIRNKENRSNIGYTGAGMLVLTASVCSESTGTVCRDCL